VCYIPEDRTRRILKVLNKILVKDVRENSLVTEGLCGLLAIR
jgi:hypothetical protein